MPRSFLLAASVSTGNTKTDQTRKSVGCTTRSTLTLSAQFRWGYQRVRAFIDAPYVRTSAGQTLGAVVYTGQYATLPMPTGTRVAALTEVTGNLDILEGRRLDAEFFLQDRRVVGVLFGSCCASSASFVGTKE